MENKKIRIGVVGTGRGKTFMDPPDCTGLELAAVCDRREDKLEFVRRRYDRDGKLGLYTDYDEMLEKADIDAVVLCNYFHEHAPFAVKALRAGKHVLSECLCASTLAEAVELCRTVEETGLIYMLAENYPFSRERLEMKRLYESGELGELLYAEGDYAHPQDLSETYNNATGPWHWRNQQPSTYYCTHAIAPIMMATGTVPVRVSGWVPRLADESYRGDELRAEDHGGIIVCQMDNGAVVRTLQDAFPIHSARTSLLCTKGGCEIDRMTKKLYVWHEEFNKGDKPRERLYSPDWPAFAAEAAAAGHSGGDFWVQYYFGEAIRKNEQPWLNVYRGCAMSVIGMLAWRSACEGGKPYDVPDFSNEEERKKVENDTWGVFRGPDDDPSKLPPLALSGWKPNGNALPRAKEAWRKRYYLGLGWDRYMSEMKSIREEMYGSAEYREGEYDPLKK